MYAPGEMEWRTRLLVLENELRKVQGARKDVLLAAEGASTPEMKQFWLVEEAGLASLEAAYRADIDALRKEMMDLGFLS